jgi:calcineurin-like phosphoesterase
MPQPMPIAKGPVGLRGAMIEIDEETGRALSIERLSREWVPPETG